MSVKILISEPWDFHDTVDADRLVWTTNGKIHYKDNGAGGDYLLIKLDDPLPCEGVTISEFVISSRLEGSTIDDLLAGKELWSGIAYVRPGKTIKPGDEFDIDDVKYSFIGTVIPQMLK